MSPSEVETIGLAKEAEDAAEGPHPPGGSRDRASDAGSSKSGPIATAPAARPRQTRWAQSIALVVMVLALLGMALALGNQLQRADRLEGRVTTLGEELGRAHVDLAAYELQMEGVRSAVDDLTRGMSALETLVNQPPGAAAQP